MEPVPPAGPVTTASSGTERGASGTPRRGPASTGAASEPMLVAVTRGAGSPYAPPSTPGGAAGAVATVWVI
jgi:hypothetical protein